MAKSTFRPTTESINYEERIEEAWEKFEEHMNEFCNKGDERDGVPSFVIDHGIEAIEKEIKEDDRISAKYRKSLLGDLKEKKKEANKLEGLAEDHRMSMQRHEGGSEFNLTLGAFQEALGR